MGFIFSKPSPPPTTNVGATLRADRKAARDAADRRRRQIAAANAGDQGTVLTSPLGVQAPATVLSPALGAG